MKKRSINIHGHQTSLTLEDEFWAALKDIASTRGLSLNKIVAEIDDARADINLCSAIRLYVLKWYQTTAKTTPKTAP